jgi:hypothetical protein
MEGIESRGAAQVHSKVCKGTDVSRRHRFVRKVRALSMSNMGTMGARGAACERVARMIEVCTTFADSQCVSERKRCVSERLRCVSKKQN